jgi:hypothetical protein
MLIPSKGNYRMSGNQAHEGEDNNFRLNGLAEHIVTDGCGVNLRVNAWSGHGLQRQDRADD